MPRPILTTWLAHCRHSIRAAALGVVFAHAAPAAAHFVWVSVTSETGAAGTARVWFSEVPAAGTAGLIDRIENATARVRTADGEAVDLELTPRIGGNAGELVSAVPIAGPLAIDVQVTYGVFSRGDEPFLLKYCAQHVRGASIERCATLCRTDKLPLNIVPRQVTDGLEVEVRWQGRPAPGAEVVLIDAAGDELAAETGGDGVATLHTAIAGTLAVRVLVVESNRAGNHDGKSYTHVRHYGTLTMNLESSASTATISATALLERARAARAVWNDFPGFEADLTVHLDDEVAHGRIRVSPAGRVVVDGVDTLDMSFANRQLASMMMHRMPGSRVGDEADDCDESGPHALGRKIRIREPRMGSVYRVLDDVITEVNRDMGKSRFTISVLDVYRNAENKYLPRAFTMSFWNTDTGALESTDTFYHHWTRIGGFDLPQDVLIVSTDEKGRRVLRMDLAKHALSGRPDPAP